MKKTISPVAFVSIIGVVLLVACVLAFRVWQGPSSTPAPGTEGKVIKPSGAIPPEAFRAKDEWRKAHPESAPGR